MKKISIWIIGGLIFFFAARGLTFAGAGGSNLTLIETGKDYIKIQAQASIITTAQYELEFEDEIENPRAGLYVITLNAFESESAFTENAESSAIPKVFFLYNPVAGPNTVKIEVNPPGDSSESLFSISQEFVFFQSELPDFTIAKLVSRLAAFGRKYAIVNVANQNSANASGPVKVICGFWDAKNNKYKEKKAFSIGKKTMAKKRAYTKKIPLKKKSPQLAYQCAIDPDNLIKESDESNNMASISIAESPAKSPTPVFNASEFQTSVLTITAEDKAVNLAKCLTQKGVKLYSASWCIHCKNQKEIFGKEAFKELNHIECYPAGDISSGPAKVCTNAKIEGFPTWDFGNGEISAGYMMLPQIAEKAGCFY